jgi:hypothetical protein
MVLPQVSKSVGMARLFACKFVPFTGDILTCKISITDQTDAAAQVFIPNSGGQWNVGSMP